MAKKKVDKNGDIAVDIKILVEKSSESIFKIASDNFMTAFLLSSLEELLQFEETVKQEVSKAVIRYKEIADGK